MWPFVSFNKNLITLTLFPTGPWRPEPPVFPGNPCVKYVVEASYWFLTLWGKHIYLFIMDEWTHFWSRRSSVPIHSFWTNGPLKERWYFDILSHIHSYPGYLFINHIKYQFKYRPLSLKLVHSSTVFLYSLCCVSPGISITWPKQTNKKINKLYTLHGFWKSHINIHSISLKRLSSPGSQGFIYII